MVAVKLPGPESVGQVGIERDPGSRATGEDFGAQIGRSLAEFGAVAASLGENMRKKYQAAEDETFLQKYQLEANASAYKTMLDNEPQAIQGPEAFSNLIDKSLEKGLSDLQTRIMKEGGYRPSKDALRRAQGLQYDLRTNYMTKSLTAGNNAKVAKLASELETNIDTITRSVAEHGELGDASAAVDQALATASKVMAPDVLEKVRANAKNGLGRSLAEYLNGFQDRALNAKTDQERQANVQAVNDLVDDAMDRGYISPESGAKFKREWSQGYKIRILETMPAEERKKVLTLPKTGKRLPRGLRNNNPGNIEFGDFARKRGAKGSDGRFAKFDTPEDGINAMASLLRSYQGRGRKTVRSMIARWAPEGENDSAAYANRVAAAMGISPDQPFSFSGNPDLAAKMIGAMIDVENGGNPFPVSDIRAAIGGGKVSTQVASLETGETMTDAGENFFGDLPPDKRVAMVNVADRQLLHEERQLQREEAVVEKETRLNLEREGYDLMLEDKLTPEWLETNKDDIGIATYKTLARSLAKDDQTWKTDPETYLKLLDEAETDPEAALENAREAYVEKRIARDVFGTIRSRAEKNINENTARPWSRDIRSFVRKSLDFGSFTTAAQKERQINAGFAFDDWMTNNPKATREESMKQAKSIIEEYRRARKTAAQTELPLPTNSSAIPGNYTTNDLAADKETLKAKLQKGEITREEAARQARLLMQWEKALTDVETALPERRRSELGGTKQPEGKPNPFPEVRPAEQQPAKPEKQSGPPISDRDREAIADGVMTEPVQVKGRWYTRLPANGAVYDLETHQITDDPEAIKATGGKKLTKRAGKRKEVEDRTAKEMERMERLRKSDEELQNFMEQQLGPLLDRLPAQ